MREYYEHGFVEKCAEFGLDPVKMAQFAEDDDRERRRRRNRRLLLTALGAGGLGVAAYMNRGRIADVIRKLRPVPELQEPKVTGDPLPGQGGSALENIIAAGAPAPDPNAGVPDIGVGNDNPVPAVPGPALSGLGFDADLSRRLASIGTRRRDNALIASR